MTQLTIVPLSFDRGVWAQEWDEEAGRLLWFKTEMTPRGPRLTGVRSDSPFTS